MSKKAQYFLIDVIFSFTILVIAIGISFYYFSGVQDDLDIFSYNVELIEQMSTTTINSLNEPEIRDFFLDNRIADVDNTVAQQIVVFMNESDGGGDAESLSSLFLQAYQQRDVSVEIILERDGVSNSVYNSSPNNIDFEDAKLSYVTSREIIVETNDEVLFSTLLIRTWQ